MSIFTVPFYTGYVLAANSPGRNEKDDNNKQPNKSSTIKKTPNPIYKYQYPGIDIALRNLNQELSSSLVLYQALMKDFKGQTELLKDWADDATLDIVWKNKIKDKFSGRRERERIEGLPDRISNCKVPIKDAIIRAQLVKPTSDDLKYIIDLQVRTAKKALIYCGVIIHLAKKAINERVSCRALVKELEEAKELLGPKKHPWICKSACLSSLSEPNFITCII
ncbi:hypothetical protein B0T17DRAFT_495927 [Bombardia bombarda]|uniref:Uncharacterized protein n=1 Tax=Bombardia bombarda TaxID=252184 RepID=A0AA39WM90_9PEZI|nr:hypothetical protein B0T17DRAFT_495927 [Bombardia bombarda]